MPHLRPSPTPIELPGPAVPVGMGDRWPDIIVLDAEMAEVWGERCEDGETDFCGWTVIGYTRSGHYTLELLVNDMNALIERLLIHRDALKAQVRGTP